MVNCSLGPCLLASPPQKLLVRLQPSVQADSCGGAYSLWQGDSSGLRWEAELECAAYLLPCAFRFSPTGDHPAIPAGSVWLRTALQNDCCHWQTQYSQAHTRVLRGTLLASTEGSAEQNQFSQRRGLNKSCYTMPV